MLTIEEARAATLQNAETLDAETVPLADCLGRVLASDLTAGTDLPPFENSAMDGYAVAAASLGGASKSAPRTLRVRGTIQAGQTPGEPVGPGEAVKIMTGAPLPTGADAVVMRERAEENGGSVDIFHAPKPGEHVRPRGEDVKAGSVYLKKGAALRPYELALLASQGAASVPVVRRPRAAVIATGDELVDPGAALAPGKIRNSNGIAIAASVAKWGALPRDMGIVPDDPDLITAALAKALEENDIVLVAGGVSVGDFDHTKKCLEDLGVRPVFWKVAMKPGKPLFFGVRPGPGPAKPVFGLPGNPVSVLVCLEEFVRPVLEKMQGFASRPPSYHMKGKALNRYPLPEGRRPFLFCRADAAEDGFAIEIIRPQASHMMGMVCAANALALAPQGPGFVEKGDLLPFRWLK